MIKHVFSIIFVMLAGSFLGACSGGDETQSTVAITPMSEPAQLTAKVSSYSGERVVVKGTSNLPNRTQLLISLENKAVNIHMEKEAVVRKGDFSIVLQAPVGGLKAGDYRLGAIMAVAAGQPKSVQIVVGNQGQHLTGTLVKNISWGGRTVEAVSTYSVE